MHLVISHLEKEKKNSSPRLRNKHIIESLRNSVTPYWGHRDWIFKAIRPTQNKPFVKKKKYFLFSPPAVAAAIRRKCSRPTTSCGLWRSLFYFVIQHFIDFRFLLFRKRIPFSPPCSMSPSNNSVKLPFNFQMAGVNNKAVVTPFSSSYKCYWVKKYKRFLL